MKKLTTQEIREEFNARKNKFAAWGEETGFNTVLQHISTAIKDLREGGIDVSLEISGDSSEQAFAMRKNSQITTPISGILRINNIERLFSITVKEGGKPCLRVSVSDFDIRFNGVEGAVEDGRIRNVVRHKSFDFKNNDDALKNFQLEIIHYSARNAVIADNDIENSLNTGMRGKKQVVKSALKKPANG